MSVWMPPKIGRSGVHRGHHPGAHTLAGSFADELANRLPCRSAERSEKLAPVKEERAQQLGDRERPETVAHALQYLLLKEGSEHGCSLRRTRGTEPSSSTREGEQILALAGVAVDARESSIQVTTVAEGVDDIVDETSPASVPGLEAFFPGPLDILVAVLDEPVEGRGLRTSRPIDGWTG